ncbi:thioviridamide family RiPP peptide [Mastigocladus laminosus UU774]|nr:thioviridamide family RiPP peptide [Mastigocladus laminosus UU774]
MSDSIDNVMNQLPLSEEELRELMNRIKQVEAGSMQLHEVAGVSPEELQEFLENKAGLSPEEESQGSPMAAAVSIAYHC